MKRTGTLRCLLLGHRFVMHVSEDSFDAKKLKTENKSYSKRVDFCVRCGVQE